MPTPLFIPTAQAAFIAGLTDRQMNRIVDEHLVPEPSLNSEAAVACSLAWALRSQSSTLQPRTYSSLVPVDKSLMSSARESSGCK